MELQQIDVFIENDGQVRLEVRGVQGGKCLDITRDLEAALGGQVTDRNLTAEANLSVAEDVQNQQRVGGQ